MPTKPRHLSRLRLLLAKDHGLAFDNKGRPFAFPVTRTGLTPTATRIAIRMSRMSKTKRVPRDRRYPWNDMNHGDSFVVPTSAERRAARTSLNAYLKTKDCHLEGDYFMVSEAVEGSGYRCFLVDGDLLPLARRSSSDVPAFAVERGHHIPIRKD